MRKTILNGLNTIVTRALVKVNKCYKIVKVHEAEGPRGRLILRIKHVPEVDL